MCMKEQYEQKLQAQLDEWNAQIDKLKVKIVSAEADTQLEYNKQIEELKSMQEVAINKLAKLKNASDKEWEELKSRTYSEWDYLGNAVKEATPKFK